MGPLDEQTQQARGTRTQSVVAVGLSLGKEKPVAKAKRLPPEGFRQGSLLA